MGKIYLKYLISVSLLVAADHARSTAYTYVGNFTPSSTQLIGGDTLTLNTSMPSSGGALILDNSGTGTVTVNLAGYNITSDGRPAISFSFQNNLIITGQGTISTSNTGTSLRHDGPNHSIQVRSNITNTNSNYALTLISMTGSSSNSATLSANLSAVLLNTSTTTGTFTNQSSGVISGVTRAVTYGGGASGDFYNYGTIQSTSGDAFFINTTNNVVIYNDGGTVTAASGYAFIDNNSGNSVINLRGGTVIGNINRSGTGTMDIIFGTLDPGNDETDFQGSIETVNSISVAENSTVNFTAGTTPLINRDIAASGSGAKLKFTGSSRTVNMGVRKVNDFSSLFADDSVTVSFDVGEAITTDVGSYNLTLTGNGTFISTVGSLIIQNTSGTFYNSSNIITTFGGATLRNTTGGTNSGTMTATDSASLVWVLDTSTTGVYYNTGTLTSPDAGTYGTVDSRSTSATLNNSGTITCSSTGNAVLLSNNSGIQTLINTGTISSLGNAISGKNAGTKTVNLNGGTITGDISNATGTMNLTFGGSTTTTFDGDINGVDTVTVSSGATVIHPNTGIPINYASAGTFTNNAGTIGVSGTTTTALQNNSTGTVAFNLNGGTVYGDIKKNSSGTTNVTFGGSTTTTFDGDINGVDTVTVSSGATVIHPNTGIPINYASAGTFTNSAGTIGVSGTTTTALQNNSTGTVAFNLNGGTIYGDIKKNSSGTTNVTFGGSTTTTFAGEFDSVDSVSVAADSTVDFTTATSITSSLDATGNNAGVRFTGSDRTVSIGSNGLNHFTSVFVDEGIILSGSSTIAFTSTGSRNLTISGSGTILSTGTNMTGMNNAGVFYNSANLESSGSAVNISATTGGTNAGTITTTGTVSASWAIGSTSTGIYANSGSISATGGNDTNGALSFSAANATFNNTGNIISTNSAKSVQLANTSGTSEFNNTGTISSLGNAISGENAGTKTVNLNGGTVTGNIANSTGTMNLTFGNSATTVFTGAMTGVNTLTVSSGATAKFTNSTGAHTISGSTVSIPGTLDFTATTSGTTTQLPSITATSANPDFSGNLIIRSSVYLYPGTFTIINGNASGTAPASTTSPTNPYVTLSSTESSGDIVLTMTRLGFNAFAKTEAGKDIGRLLESIAYNSPNSTYQQLLNQLDTNLGINENLLQLIPDTTPSLSAVNIQNSGIQKVLLRLSELRKHTDGYYAGTPVAVPKAWLKIIGNTSSQNTTDKIAGYNARTAGAVIGYDQEVENVFSVGAAAAYSLTNTKQKANSNSRTDTKTAQLMIYGSHYYDHFVVDYFDWVLSAGYNAYNGQRAINIGSFNSVAQSEYSGRQYSAKGVWGLNYEPFRYVTASPEASLHYSYLRQKAYRETGNSGVNLTVDSMNTRSLEFAIGGKITVHNYDTNSIYKELELSAKFYHQSINGFGNASRGTQRADVSLEGATGTFIVSNEPSRRGLRLGVASTLVATDRIDLKISYDLDIRGGYRGHTGGLEFRYWF